MELNAAVFARDIMVAPTETLIGNVSRRSGESTS